MVAMHITTKEIRIGLVTFWWQNGRTPGNFPGVAQHARQIYEGRVAAYAMCIADAIVVPFNDPKGKPIVCFNPGERRSRTIGLNSQLHVLRRPGTVAGADYPST